MALDPSNAFALDVNAVTKLKYSTRAGSAKGLKPVARQFEAMMLQQMLKSMRAAIPKSGLLDGQQQQSYYQMADAQWAQALAKRGVGVADLLTRQLEQRGLTKPKDQSKTDPLAGIAHAEPKPLGASEPISANQSKTASASATPHDSALPLVAARAGAPLFALSAANPAAAKISSNNTEPPNYVTRFIQRMGGAADRAARQTGLPRRLILAQAALESGWGRHEVSAGNGQKSFNVFNIKAAGWHGPSADATTTEFKNGAAQSTRAGFRVYRSYDQAFSDYARLLSQSPRYAPVIDASSAPDAARALQSCGYATDPAYADKLVAIMKQIPADAQPATGPLFTDSDTKPLVDLGAADGAAASDAAGPAGHTG